MKRARESCFCTESCHPVSSFQGRINPPDFLELIHVQILLHKDVYISIITIVPLLSPVFVGCIPCHILSHCVFNYIYGPVRFVLGFISWSQGMAVFV
jgi:hypothetical protein